MDTQSYEYDLSVHVARRIRAEPYRCWRNAVVAIVLFPELFGHGCYVEGWIVLLGETSVEIVEHGWSASGEKIVDPSLVLVKKRGQPTFYFPGLVLPSALLVQSLQGKTLPLVCHSTYGEDGMGHRAYKNAYERAWQRAQDLAREQQFPETAILVSRRNTQCRGVTVIDY